MLDVNTLTSSNVVNVVPMGLMCKATYNENGVISGIYTLDPTTQETKEKLPSNYVADMQKEGLVPSRLTMKSKFEVNFVVKPINFNVVQFQKMAYDNYVQSILDMNDTEVEVVAYYGKSDNSIMSHTNVQMMSRLSMFGFKTADTFMCSEHVINKQSNLQKILLTSNYPFVNGYQVSSGLDHMYIPSNVKVLKVSSCDRCVNEHGFIQEHVTFTDETHMDVPYTDIVRNNVQKGSVVAIDNNHIVYCNDLNNQKKKVPNQFHCDYCGTLVHVPFNGYMKCSYDNCVSTMLDRVQHMVNSLNMKKLDVVTYWEYVNNKQIHILGDVFDLPQYKDCEVQCTVADILWATCPVSVIRNRDFFDKLVTCAGSLDAVNHYLENPNEIQKDMIAVLPVRSIESYTQWISIPENLLTVKSMMDIPNVHVKTKSLSLNVPKIFRNKGICLEGQFKHGSFQEVSNILESYGASVVATFSPRVDCVVLGDFVRVPESDTVARTAVSYNIPVYAEKDFFKAYNIDSDLTSNQ